MKAKKLLSVVLSLVIVFLSLPLMAVNTSAAEQYSMDKLKEMFPSGKYWTHKSTDSSWTVKTVSSYGVGNNGYVGNYQPDGSSQCHGFACVLAEYYSGTTAKESRYSKGSSGCSVDNIRVGDKLRIDVNGNGVNDDASDHTVFVIAVSSSDITVAECNWNCSSTNKINWGRTISKSSLKTSMLYLDHYKEITQTHTHSYTGEYYEAAHPHKVYKSCSCGATYYTGGTVSYLKCSTCMSVKERDLQGYILSSSSVPVYDNINIYNRKQVATLNSNTSYYIGEVYDCGWCSIVKEATQNGGVIGTARPSGTPDPNLIGYVPTSTFFPENSYYTSSFNKISLTASSNLGSYRRNDLANSYVTVSRRFTIVGYKDNAVQIIDDQSYTNDYICWIPTSSLTFNATYNANGGTGSVASTSAQYPNKLYVNSNAFSKSGYTFLGWNIQRKSDSCWYYKDYGWCTASDYIESKYTKCVYNGGISYDMSNWINGSSTNETFIFYAVWQKNPVTVSSIAVNAMPSKTTYTVGEAFSSSGLSIKVNMSDGTSNIVTNGFTLSAPDMSTAGTKTVTVTYQGKTATFPITVKAVDTNNPSIKIDAGKAVCGQQVNIPVIVEKTDLGTLTIDITYDSSKLNIASISEIPFDMYDTNTKTPGKIRITATGNASVPAGRVAVLTFDVIATSSCSTDISITVDEAYDANDKTVELTPLNGVLEILKAVPGDVNGDGKVSAIDARMALQYNAGNKELTAEQIAAADVNGDGKVSAIDARWILQAVAGNREF